MKRKILLVMGLILGAPLLAPSSTDSVFALANPKMEISGLDELKESYMVDDEITIPSMKVSYKGVEYDSSSYVKYPSGNVVSDKTIILDEYGEYTVTYLANVEEKVVSESVTFDAYQRIYDVVGNKSTTTYGTHEYMGDDVGILLSLSQNETFTFNKPIDLSKYNSANKILSFRVIPETIGVADASKLIVTLTDCYDSDNYIRIEIKKCDDNMEKWAEVNTYVTANAANQDAIGLEAGQTTGNLITYDGKVYRFHRNNAYGANISFSMAGSPLYESKSNPNYDPAYLKEQIFNLSMDYESGKIYAGSNTTFVTDLKSDVIYGNTLWDGFTTGEAYLTLQATNYNADTCNLFIKDLANEAVTSYASNIYKDEEGPEITIDLKGFDENNLPVGQVNQKFTLFEATAYDNFDKDVEVKKAVYLNRGLSNECKIDVVDNAFTPKYNATYDVVYTAKDLSGNVSSEILKVTISEEAKSLSIDMIEDGDSGGYAGQVVHVSTLSYKDNQGDVSETIVATHNETGETYEVTNHSFIPLEEGDYTITYSYQDFLYSKEYSYVINVEKTNTPSIIDDISLPKYLLKNCEYNLPILKAYEFSSGKANEISTKTYVQEDGGSFFEMTNGVYTPEASSQATIKYEATSNGETTSKQIEVPVVDVGFNESLSIGSYMKTNDFTFTAESKYIDYTTTTTDNPSMEFVQALQADDFQMRFTATEGADNYSKITLLFTDSEDESVTLKATYEKTRLGTVSFSVNDGDAVTYDTLFSSNNNPIQFEYDNSTLTLSPHPNKYQSLNGFEGFPSRYFYLTIQLEEVTSSSSLRIVNIGGQPFTKVAGDIIDPKICATYDLGDKEINSVVTIKGATISDVLDPSVKAYMTVTDPDNNIVTSNDGTLLDENADFTKDYEVTLSKYGDYLVYYKAVDSNQNQTIYSYVITVVDKTAPTVEILNPVTSGKVNQSIKIASILVTDNSQSDYTVYVSVKTPDGSMISLANVDSTVTISGSFTPLTSGLYVVYYYVMDASGNSAVASYSINVSD